MATIYHEVELEVDLEDFATDDLIEELRSRDVVVNTENITIVNSIYEAKARGQDYEALVNQLIYNTLGRIA